MTDPRSFFPVKPVPADPHLSLFLTLQVLPGFSFYSVSSKGKLCFQNLRPKDQKLERQGYADYPTWAASYLGLPALSLP